VAGTAAADLHALAAFLQLPSFHLLGTAGGAFVAIDYAISHPDSLLSLIIASSTGDIDDPAYKADCARLAAPDLLRLPSDLKELGPAYRAGYPAGHARWNELEAMARTRPGARQAKENDVSWENVSKIRAPTLLISGGADSYSPPPIMEMVSARIPNSSLVVIDEAGHSAYWEQPRAFNDAVLNFLGGISVNRKPAAALGRHVSQDTVGG
jgi:pimeloyl-ACP methyl ester carboxylesterase